MTSKWRVLAEGRGERKGGRETWTGGRETWRGRRGGYMEGREGNTEERERDMDDRRLDNSPLTLGRNSTLRITKGKLDDNEMYDDVKSYRV